jgi:hypothetical protein
MISLSSIVCFVFLFVSMIFITAYIQFSTVIAVDFGKII